MGVFIAYLAGAAAGWTMMERTQRDQWRHQAELNAQIVSAGIRAIYTFVSVDVSAAGQTSRIVSDLPIGDDQSVLDTGFVPADVLALAAAQTREKVWLFRWDKDSSRFLAITDGNAGDIDAPLTFIESEGGDGTPERDFHIGVLRIGGDDYFGGFIPILTRDGRVHGALVASAGRTETLTAARWRLFVNAAMLLTVVMVALGAAIVLLMHRLSRPVPALIHALTRLARNETDKATPYQERTDEIGDLAVAIETLRAAVVEREELRKIQEVALQMEHLAHHDSLTGLPNRALFQKSLSAAIEGMAKGGARINLFLLDLDRFKPVNDRFGHAVGDKVLAMSCERMTAILGPKDLAARLGGDEFANIQSVAFNPVREAEKVAARLIDAISRPFDMEGAPSLSIGVSIGIACAPAHGDSTSDLLCNADLALYAAKHAGRGKFQIFRPGMTMPGDAGGDSGKDMLLALARGEFELHYQPQFRLADGCLHGYEALLFWRRPGHDPIPSDAFIPQAEANGAILPIGRWVMEQVCTAGMKFGGDVVMSVAVSAAQIGRDDLGAIIADATAATGYPAGRLEIELAGSVTELDREWSRRALAVLRGMGVGIAIGDFAAGSVPFSSLTTLPVTRLKIGCRLVSGPSAGQDTARAIAGIVAVAGELGLSTTADGVESAGQIEQMRIAGVDLVQGPYIGHPEPLDILLAHPAAKLPSGGGVFS